MLRALDPPDEHRRRITAYRVPWVVDRARDTHPVVTNGGHQPLDFVRVFVHGPGAPPHIESWGMMLPGGSAELCLCDEDIDDTIVTIAWFRPDDGAEYIWRFVV